MSYCQYPGEENFIIEFFNHKKRGLCIEMGAANGVVNSNSRKLIQDLEWRAVLVEPHPAYFSALESLYAENELITLKNVGVYSTPGKMDFHISKDDDDPDNIGGQASTFSLPFKKKVIEKHGDGYVDTVRVEVITLEEILEDCGEVDFLSVDCEGVDMEVLKSNDWTKYRPHLLCIEFSMEGEELQSFADSIDYIPVGKSHGNVFLKPSEDTLSGLK